ncbi:RNA polymerase sigma factor [Candidatus Palauibacter sp.]|uniref:RNA polymerase sigma factor n=1 Tax=Candidatus Palauibacter sp. TaxID=3101350 RepID=UPI003B5A1E17
MVAFSRERRLARAAARGDQEAVRALYERFSEELFAVAYRLTDSSADARDVLHDVFSRLPHTLRTFDLKWPLGPWLHAVTTRVALDRLRRERRRGEVSLRELADEESPVVPVLDSVALERALSSLPEDLRTVIILKELGGYSHREIGELLGIAASTSAGRLYSARAALRAALFEQ